MKPLVYVITVVFNGEKTIKTTINSVLDQTYENLKYIIIDGGSSDNTIEIVKKYSSQINCFISEKDTGVYDAMNKGIKCSMEEDAYLLFLNADDFFTSKDIVERVMRQVKNEDFIYCKINYFSDKEQIILGEELNMKELGLKKMCYHQATFYRKGVFDQIGLYDIRYRIAADYEMSLRVFSNPSLSRKYINEIVSNVSAGGLSNQYLLSINEKIKIIKKYFSLNVLVVAILYNYFYITPICFIKELFNPKLYAKHFHESD